MIQDKLNSILRSIRSKIDEISMLITGEPETMVQDIVYEDLVYYLKNLEVQIEVVIEIIDSYE